MNNYILIIDFGSQTTHLIGRKIRELGIDIKIVDPEDALKAVRENKPQGLIFSGGPSSVYEKGAPDVDQKIFKQNIPILGICYGWQLIAQHLGGKVTSGHKEYGPANLKIIKINPLLKNIEKINVVWLSHGDTVEKIPTGFQVWGSTENVAATLVGNPQKNIYGVQFHPEIEHSQCGKQLLKNFVEKVCNLKTSAKKDYETDKIIKMIKEKVGDKKVICGVSGGVDSTVAAFLIGKAIGKNLYPVYIDSGLNRFGTTELVKKIFQQLLGIDPIIVDARKEFLRKLKGVTEGEKKRKIIGKLYIDLFAREAKKLKGIDFLAQGTIYSDVIESKGTKNASKIKSHHNVGGLPKSIKFQLLEPLRNFYKDEVREIALKLGIPHNFVFQQKFPGPGYAIRIMGEVNDKRLRMVEQADRIVIEEITNAGYYYKVFHSFAIMTGAFSTALKGDARKFREVIALRILEATEEMTADWAKLPYAVIQKISSRIINEVPDVSRIVYDVTTKPPATMEWE